MVAEHLLELRQPVAGDLLEPGRVALVQVGAELLRHRLVRRLADQDVPEAEAVDAGERRPVRGDQLLADERAEALLDLAAQLVVGERLDRARVEDRSLDRRPLDRPPLAAAQLVEPRGEQHLDRRGHGQLVEAGGRAVSVPPR